METGAARRYKGPSTAPPPPTMLRRLASLLLLALALPWPAPWARAQDGTFAIRGARVLPVVGPELRTGTVLVREGKIAAVGAEVELPEGVPVLEAEGLVLIPGLVDPYLEVGAGAGGARAEFAFADAPLATLRTLDSIRPGDLALRRALARGVTSANLVAGGPAAGGGQTAYVKLRGRTVEEMAIDLGARTGGLELRAPRGAACFVEGGTGLALVDALSRASAYRDALKRHRERLAAGQESVAPVHDPEAEILIEVLERRRTLHLRLEVLDDLAPALELAETFGLELAVHARGTSLSVDPGAAQVEEFLAAPAGRGRTLSLDPFGLGLDGAGPEGLVLATGGADGLRLVLDTPDAAGEARPFLHAGALALRAGSSGPAALRASTLDAARLLHLEDRIGSIERGKHADLVLLSGDPFSIYTRVLATWIEGRKVFDRSSPADLRLATGGHAVAERLAARDRAPIPPQVTFERRAVERPAQMGTRFAVEAEWLFTAAGPPISKGIVLVDGGRIQAVGAQGEIELPPGTPVLRAQAVTPGLIDAHVAVALAPDGSAPALDPAHPRAARLRAQGVSVVQLVPEGGGARGVGAAIARTYGDSAGSALLRAPSALVLDLTAGGSSPEARMGNAASVRVALQAARARTASAGAGADSTLHARAASGELPTIFVARRAEELSTALRIARELDLRCILSQAAEGHLVAAEIARAAAPVLVAPPFLGPQGTDTEHGCTENAALLREAGAAIALVGARDGALGGAHPLALAAGLGAVEGLGGLAALRAVTVDAARLLGLEAERGSLERGKAADLALWDGDPLEPTTRLELLVGEGRVVFDRAAPR